MNKVVAFPAPIKSDSQDWEVRFHRIFDHGEGFFLTFPFTYFTHRQALLALYQAVPKVLSKYPGLVEEFFDDARRACETAEKKIEQDRLKNLPGDPGQLLTFNKISDTV